MMKYIKNIFSIILILVFAYIVLGEIFFPIDSPFGGNICDELPRDKWVILNEDGSEIAFELPGKADGNIVLKTYLPDVLNKDYNVLCLRGEDMAVYVGGELRSEIAPEDFGFFGDRSTECYIFAPIYPEDAGKEVLVNYGYNSGMVYEVYIGTRLGILADLFRRYGLELLVGFAIIILGVICYIASLSYRLIHKKYLEMEHLSLGIILGACWVLSNSVFRQLYTRNLAVMGDIPYLMVLILPIPFIILVDLFVLGKMEIDSSFIFAAVCALISIVFMFTTIILDAKRGNAFSYRFVIYGFVVFAFSAVVQMGMFLFAHNGVFSGLFMSIGLFGFIICAMIHTIKQLIGIRVEANEFQHVAKAKDDFLANMSHEIRTPLNGILGMDEMILRDTKESRIRDYALEIKSASNTLLSIINDILDLSKIESGNFDIIPVDYDVASVLNDVLNMTRHRAVKKGLEFNFNVSETIPSVLHGDEIRIRQVMLNIINNAVKYTREGHVDVNISSESIMQGNYVELILKVTDTGIGIKDEDKEKLFRSFQRLDVTKMMNGKLSVESEYGKGSEFTVTIPQKVVKASPIGDFSDAVKNYLKNIDLNEVGLYAPSASILVVDDNEMNLDVMEGLLRDTRIKADFVTSGALCIEYAQKKKYDCILLDQMMPQMNGEETLKELKEKDILNGTPVIALTADAIIGAKESYLEKGFTDYISKPVKYEVLELALKNYIPKEKQLSPSGSDELPLLLIWSEDPKKITEAREKLDGIYKCVCITGEKAKDKYLEKHTPDAVMHV